MKYSLETVYERLLVLKDQHPVHLWPPGLRTTFREAALHIAAQQRTPFFPPIVYIEPTNACNANCVICPRAHMTRKIGFMDMTVFSKIINDIYQLGPSELRLFNYGEPMIHSRLPDMVELGISKGLQTRFQTNGMIASKPMITRLLKAGLDYIGVSVNGLTAEEYSMIRPGFNVEHVINNVRLMRETATDSGRPLHIHINAQILQSDLKHRKQEIEAYKRLWLGLADSLSISGLSLYDHIAYVNCGHVTKAHLQDLERKPDSAVMCTEPFDRLIIKWDGRVTLCCADYDASLVVGDITQQSLREIWQSPTIKQVREHIRNNNYQQVHLCQTCPKFYSDSFTMLYTRHQHGQTSSAPAKGQPA